MPRQARLARTPASRLLRRWSRAAAVTETTGAPIEETVEELREAEAAAADAARARATELEALRCAVAEGSISRRAFLRGSAAIGAGAAALGLIGPASAAAAPAVRPRRATASTPRVVIIGAGAAGVRAADVLQRSGIPSTVYEAADRIGGRTYSDPTTFPGQIVEHGGELISSEHWAVRHLVHDLGLRLEVVNGGGLLEGEELYLIDGSLYTEDAATADWAAGAWKAFKDELSAAPWPQRYDDFTRRGAELDRMTVVDWFDPANPLANPILAGYGPASRLARLLATNSVTEYGADPWMQPALNLLYLDAWNPRKSLSPLPGTDEYYHIVEGSQSLVDRMVARFSEVTIHTGRALDRIEGTIDGPYTCWFADGSSAVADHLILALPFRLLREVEIDPRIWTAFRPAKQRAIERNPMGTNAKIQFQLTHRTWGPGQERVIDGAPYEMNGIGYSDPDGFQCLWDARVPDPPSPAYLLYYPGGEQGASLRGRDPFGAPNPADVRRVLGLVEGVFPGTSDAYTGRAIQSFWTADPWHHGAYSYWGIGHYTSYVGAEALQEGRIHFAGEHTSVEFQGYINGALETGERAATEVSSET